MKKVSFPTKCTDGYFKERISSSSLFQLEIRIYRGPKKMLSTSTETDAYNNEDMDLNQ